LLNAIQFVLCLGIEQQAALDDGSEVPDLYQSMAMASRLSLLTRICLSG
jgi:hypothetical protein